MLQTPLAQFSTLLALAVTVWAVVAGRWPERVVAIGFGLDWAIGVVFQDHRAHHHAQWASFAPDCAVLLVTLVLVMRCRRTWLLWAAALALLLVLTHVAVLLSPRFGQWSYLTASYIWSFGFLAALAAGVAFEGRRPPPILVWRLRAARPSTPSATVRSRS